MNRPFKHIAISGNIGSGKTVLTEKLARHYGWNALFESVDQNPYLKDFYYDMSRWAFHLQIYFLNSRFQQISTILKSSRPTIQDRTIYEDAYIFATNLHKSGFISDRDFESYWSIFNSMITFAPPPDLLIYLKADVPKLVAQIQKRGREYENVMSIEYLQNLNEHYRKWIAEYKLGRVLIVDVNHLDFVDRQEDFAYVVERVEREINSLFG